MKKLNSSIILLLVIGIVQACGKVEQESQHIVQESHINKFLTEDAFRSSTGLEEIEGNISFWKKKLATAPNSMIYHSKLAGAFAYKFGVTKNISDLHHADSLYNVALKLPGGKNVENLQALTHLAITKHRFAEAQRLASEALAIGEKKAASQLLMFDIQMERGDYELALRQLENLEHKQSFGYQIRLSRFKDYQGDLDSAIHYMERANGRIGHNHSLLAWSQSNLGDKYGHANHIQKSYQSYLRVLQEEQTGGSWLHSLEGMAWIAYAHDKNPELAERILLFVDRNIGSPEVKLQLAELAEYQNQPDKKMKYIRAFVKEAGKPDYYRMYDTYLIEVLALEMNNADRAMELLAEELKNRPNPLSFNLQALVYLQMGEAEKALKIIENKVKGHTHEPLPAFHMAKVYKANGLKAKARTYFREALLASYELGPVTAGYINKELDSL